MLNYFLTTNNIKDFKIFVRLTNKKYYDIEKLSLENIYIFGETDNIYAKSILVDQKLDNLAKQVNYYYLKKDPNNTLNIDEAWNECSYFNKASSRSSANSIIIKLNLLGLTLKETKEGLTKEEYLRYYNDNKALEEDVFFDINTYQYDNKRINLGILEHLRWNTFEIYNNHLPMEKSKILNVENKHYQRKDNTLKQHANILSMQGLFELEKALKDVDFVPYRDKTIFIKDFDLMDNLYEIIQDSDYKIVKK